MKKGDRVRVRIAPSPTGDPHVGTAYIALFNYVFAKKFKGDFVLRIEDTDQARAKSTAEQMIMQSLKWLGLTWDEGPDVGGQYGPYKQSERSGIYKEHVKNLVDAGKAYYCFCSAGRLEEVRKKQQAGGSQTGYDRKCRDLSPDEVKKRLAAGEQHVVRLKMPTSGVTSFQDFLRGKIEIESARLDDQVLLKSDGLPTYHLANVVDDHLMMISHVIRAEEWISSTPKHVVLYQSFGWPEPVWVHMPLLRNTDKSKISKRKNPISLEYYRRIGILPEVLVNFLALMGWSFGNDIEIFSLDQMIERFDLKNINLGGPVFDLVKLSWLNQQYIQKLDPEKFIAIIRNQCLSPEYLRALYPLVKERISRFDEFFDKFSFFFNSELNYQGISVLPADKGKDEFARVIQDLIEELDELYEWDEPHLKTLLDNYRAKINWKPKDFFMPLRFIVTGRKDSPDLMGTIAVLGREIVRARIRNFLNQA